MLKSNHGSSTKFSAADTGSHCPIDVDGNELRVFTEYQHYIEALLCDVRQARQRVWIESFTIADDPAGRDLAEALSDRAASGVDCRISYDAIGSLRTSNEFFSQLDRAGVKIHKYRPLSQRLLRPGFFGYMQRRNHRKLVVIDDRLCYFGGMNIMNFGRPVSPGDSAVPGHASTDLNSAAANPYEASDSWRDIQIRLVGPAARNVATAFLALWPRAKGERPVREVNPSVREILSASSDAIYFIDTRPRLRHRRPGPIFKALIDRSRTRINVMMAYFLPVGGVLRKLRKATRRGVHVKVILPACSDVRVVQWATEYMYDRLLSLKIHIFERQNRMLHSKAMVIDDDWTVVGSCNFDPRSLFINIEFLAVIRSSQLASTLHQIFSYEQSHSQEVCIKRHRQRNFVRRIVQFLAWQFRRWL